MSISKIITIIGFLTMFIVGVSDLIIVGMMSEMSQEFHVSNAFIGQLVTIYAISFSILSPILTRLTININDKKVLIYSLMIFILLTIITTIIENYILLCVVRVILAGVASLITVKLMSTGANMVPIESKSTVIANIYVGFSAANILGIPIGTLLASYYGWKIPFYIIAILTFFCLLSIVYFIPTNIKRDKTHTSKYTVTNYKGTIIILCFLLFMMISNSILFTYLEPLVKSKGHDIFIVSLCLFLSGIAGVLGSKLGNTLSEKKGYSISGNIIILMYIISIILILILGQNIVILVSCVFIWNLFHWGTNPTVQYGLLKFLRGDPSQILSYDISILNLGIGLGSFVGGILFFIDNSFNLSIIISALLAILSSLLLKGVSHSDIVK
ncbi:MFS transporter [Staphylococcus caprae]|uniref:MFS transporter n=1 Tax=Staphylococcus caprae TaxID=29380 RepID=UPI000CD259E8|nr:MFS transporter [Staphylococcus caprae]POA02596.1 MFS transporter [Staphylococcus caprae]SUL89617.1 membrane protein [Staphylococcus caprae]